MAWALVQRPTAASLASGTSGSLAFGSNVVGGNLLVAVLILNNFSSIVMNTPTDTRSSTWTGSTATTTGLVSTNSQSAIKAWAAVAPTSGADTVNVSWVTTATTGTLAIAEFSGITGSPTQQDGAWATDDHASSGTIVGPTYTPTVTGDLAILFACTHGNISSINAPWASLEAAMGGSGGGWGYQSATLASVTGAGTLSSADFYASAIFAIQAGAVAIISPPRRSPLGV